MRESDDMKDRATIYGKPPLIIVIEDYLPAWDVFDIALRKLQFHVEFFRWAEDAVEFVRKNECGLIYFDLSLPQREDTRERDPLDDISWGERVFAQLTNFHKGHIVVVTGNSQSHPGQCTLRKLAPQYCLSKVETTPDDITRIAQTLLSRTNVI